jgi:predicted enzyme related to lactoylglutathione lyase
LPRRIPGGAASNEEPSMPRPIHFEIQAENAERAIAFYRELLGWEFSQWGKEPYWLVKTGEKGTPGIDGGLMPRRGGGPADMQPVNAFVCTVDVTNLDAMVKRVTELRGSIALPKMPIPTVGWLVYAKDTEGNIFGMMQMDADAK